MRFLLKLYPQAWRERYEEEMLAVLMEHKITPATVVDLLIGAFDAHLNDNGFAKGARFMRNQLRSGLVMTFCAFMVFGVGWGALQRITDPLPLFQAVNKLYPELGILHDTVFIVGCFAFLAFLISGLPIFFISIKRAFENKQKNVLILFWVALSCLLLFIFETAILANWNHISFVKHHFYAFFLSYLGVVVIELVTGAVTVSLILARTEYQLRELRFMLIPEIILWLSMVISVVCSIVLISFIAVFAPQLFNTQDVGSPMFISGLVVMAIGTLVASMGLKRGKLIRIN